MWVLPPSVPKQVHKISAKRLRRLGNYDPRNLLVGSLFLLKITSLSKVPPSPWLRHPPKPQNQNIKVNKKKWSPKGHVGLHSLSTPSTSRRIDQMVPRYMEILQRNALNTKKVSWTSTPVMSRKVDFFINTGGFKDTSRLVLGNLHVCCVYSSTSWKIDGSIKGFKQRGNRPLQREIQGRRKLTACTSENTKPGSGMITGITLTVH